MHTIMPPSANQIMPHPPSPPCHAAVPARLSVSPRWAAPDDLRSPVLKKQLLSSELLEFLSGQTGPIYSVHDNSIFWFYFHTTQISHGNHDSLKEISEKVGPPAILPPSEDTHHGLQGCPIQQRGRGFEKPEDLH